MPEDIDDLHDLKQAKRRDRKVYITDIAIDKVPYIKYDGFTDERNRIMQELAKDVLLLSKERNDSNEVAITCDLGAENPLGSFGVSLGTEHEVDILADTLSNHIIVSRESVAVVVLLGKDSPKMEMYMASLTFLAKCSEVGLFYR